MNKNADVIANSETAYIDSINRSILGFASGFIGYNFIYSLIIALLFQSLMITFNIQIRDEILNMILSLIVSLFTLLINVWIANPKKLIKAYNKIGFDKLKLILKTLVTMLIFTIGYNLLISLLGVDVTGGNTNQESVVKSILGAPILAFITFVIVAPISEEITYRYFLFGGIRKISPKWAIIISGFVFMLIHGLAGFISGSANIVNELLLLPPYMFSGCMLAYSYNKSDNLAVSTSVHVLNNLLSFILSII